MTITSHGAYAERGPGTHPKAAIFLILGPMLGLVFVLLLPVIGIALIVGEAVRAALACVRRVPRRRGLHDAGRASR